MAFYCQSCFSHCAAENPIAAGEKEKYIFFLFGNNPDVALKATIGRTGWDWKSLGRAMLRAPSALKILFTLEFECNSALLLDVKVSSPHSKRFDDILTLK